MEWTADRILMLTKLVDEGRSFSYIAEKLKVFSRSAVIGKAKRLGLQSKSTQAIARAMRVKGEGSKPKLSETKLATVQSTPRPKTKVPVVIPEAMKSPKSDRPRKRVRLPADLKSIEAFDKRVEEITSRPSSNDITNIPGQFRCKWIDGDVKAKTGEWCRDPVVSGTCWCQKHLKRVYPPISAYTGRIPKSALQRR